MKFTVTTKDSKEAERLAKADDMAYFIWELVHNGHRQFKDTDYDYEKVWNVIHSLLDEHNINIDELVNN